jgi:hypothetical protein
LSNENPELTLESLREKHNQAWINLKVFLYETYEPRFYRSKKGRKLEYINGWKSLEERTEAEKRVKFLHDTWDQLMKEYWRRTGEHLHLPRVYVEKETPDGPRWVKETPEEATTYEKNLHNSRI